MKSAQLPMPLVTNIGYDNTVFKRQETGVHLGVFFAAPILCH